MWGNEMKLIFPGPEYQSEVWCGANVKRLDFSLAPESPALSARGMNGNSSGAFGAELYRLIEARHFKLGRLNFTSSVVEWRVWR